MSSILAGREILIVEDETMLRKRLASFLEESGASCSTASSVEEGANLLEGVSFDFALVDVHLPDGLGLDLLEKAHGTLIVIMTADGGWEVAVEAMKRGAADYLAKPFELEEIPLVFGRCVKAKRRDRSQQHRLSGKASSRGAGSMFFGETLKELAFQLERIIEADNRLRNRLPPVLIEGETGTGKSTIARWLHAQGPRKDKELVVVNCAALPDQLAESELFGHEKGAFTDAKQSRIGLFEAADGGTLFLDEIASLSAPLQAKVLVAIEEGRIRKLGGTREIEVDARVLAASNKRLEQLAADGAFREDLYHRLNLFHVSIPPLRERRSDILSLATRMLADLAGRYRIDGLALSGAGERQLLSYGWPGNLRELRHELERAVVMGNPEALEFPNLVAGSDGDGGSLGEEQWFNPSFRFPEEGFDLEEAIDTMVAAAIEQSAGNVSKASRLLGVQRDYIRYREKKRRS